MATTMTITARTTGRFTAGLLPLIIALILFAPRTADADTRWTAAYFPDVVLTTQTGARVRFRDLIRGRTVAIELIYTRCQFACPLETARLAQVQRLLGSRMGRDVFFYSISIDPEHDTPAALRAFARQYGAGRGWTFLTGRPADVELLSRKLGLYSTPDPANRDGHIPALLVGHEPSGQWMQGSALDNPRLTATMIANWIGGMSAPAGAPGYATAKPLVNFDAAAYLFSTKCSACHSVGGGPRVGPDLAGVTRRRDRAWLTRFIAAPDALLNAGDPIARELSARANGLRMPNLGLTERQIEAILAYLDKGPTRRSR